MNNSEAKYYMGGTQVVGIYLGSTPIWTGGCECEGEPGEFEVLCCDANGGSSSYTYSGGVIPAWEFYDNTDIVAVKIGSGITHIGENNYSYVFADSPNITAITLGPDVEYIGGRAFEGIPDVTSITIPASVTGIGTNAFYAFDSATFIFEGPCPTFSMEEHGDLGYGDMTLVVPEDYLQDYCNQFCCEEPWTGSYYVVGDEGSECVCDCPAESCDDWEDMGYESYEDCTCQEYGDCPEEEPDCMDECGGDPACECACDGGEWDDENQECQTCADYWEEWGFSSEEDCRCQKIGDCPEEDEGGEEEEPEE